MKDRIIETQCQILDGLITCESMIGELYRIYAGFHPQSSSFWSLMASEEQTHADMLASLKKQLEAGHPFWNIGPFRPEAIAKEVAFVKNALEKARSGTPAESECLATAMHIEMSIMESKFYSLVKSDAEEFATICKVLSDATAAHAQRLRDKIDELTRKS